MYIKRVGELPLALMAEESLVTGDSSLVTGQLSLVTGQLLTESLLSATVVEATARWQASGLLSERQLAALATVETTIADLSGAQLGLASPGAGRIWIDRDAAGRGWHTSRVAAFIPRISQPSSYDLLTAVMHELGHIAGYDHEDEIAGDLMNATCEPANPARMPWTPCLPIGNAGERGGVQPHGGSRGGRKEIKVKD